MRRPMLPAVMLAILVAATAPAQTDLDFGDAPDAGVDPQWSYPTVLADDGARHLVPASPTHFLGGAPIKFTVRVSVDSTGVQGNNPSWTPSISADGRFVAFRSMATNLVPGDTNGKRDVFVHDRVTGATSRASVDSSGVQGNDRSYFPSISADGRYVAFDSEATNLVPGDTNGARDVFVHDRITGTTILVSVDSSGVHGNGPSYDTSISADGRYVAFRSYATALVPGDTNGDGDVFVHDRITGATSRVSVDSSGVQANGQSYFDTSISADGRYVAFHSWATNLVPGDTNSRGDIFVHDRDTSTTTRVSVDSFGAQANDGSWSPSISADGRFVAFSSGATNLAPGVLPSDGQVYLHDRTTGTTTHVSVNSSGVQSNGLTTYASISADGRIVAFMSWATNLVPGDTNGSPDIFVHDRDTATTVCASVNSTGFQGNSWSDSPSISADGRFIAFESEATNLAPGDTNGHSDVFVHGEDDMLDAEPDGAPTTAAVGDDRDGNDDEDGVRFPCCLYPGGTTDVLIDASAAGYVNAWIDFNGDGDWGDGGEQILTDHAVAPGMNQISYSVPAGGAIPATYARVRFTSYDPAGALGVTGLAGDGEVEDYPIDGTPLFADGFETGTTTEWSGTVP